MFREDRIDDRPLGQRFARLRQRSALRLEIVDMESKDVAVLDGVGDRVGVKAVGEQILRFPHAGLIAFDFLLCSVLKKYWCASEAKELSAREELLDSLVVLAELRTVALVEDKGDALIAQGFQLLLKALLAVLFLLLVALAVLVQREAKLLDRADDDLVGVIVRKKAPNEGRRVGVLLDAAFLELVEFLARLAIKVLAIHDEEAFLDVGIVL